jgi:hypothetical protein
VFLYVLLFFLQICLICRHPISNIRAIRSHDHKFERSGWWIVGRRIEGSVVCTAGCNIVWGIHWLSVFHGAITEDALWALEACHNHQVPDILREKKEEQG